MSILYKNYRHCYFNDNLLVHIRNGENDKVRSILRDSKDCHLLACTSGATLLHFAAKYGNTEISQYLIDLGANVDAENQIKETPLMYAVEAKQVSTVRTLVDANADVLKRGGLLGISVLWNVIYNRVSREYGSTELAEKEIRQNIMMAVLSKVTSSEYFKSIKASDAIHLDRPLYYFIESGNVEVTRALLEEGHLIKSALHEAARRLDLENIKVLLEYNADVNAYDKHGKTPLACIENFDDQKKTLTVVKTLIDAAGAMLVDHDRHVILAQSILLKGNGEMIETLLQYPIDLNVDYEKTPLWYLVNNKNPKTLEKLRELRADVFEQSKEELLCIAAEECRTDPIKFLLNCGADVNAKDQNNYSVLRKFVRKAVKLRFMMPQNDNVLNEYLECIHLLLEHGADPQKFEISDNLIQPFDEQSEDHQVTSLIEPIFAHLSLLEVSGQAINELTQNEIQSSLLIGNVFQTNKRHIEEMKKINIEESVTLVDFLTANNQRIFLYARNKVLFSNLTNAMKGWSFNSYSGRMLDERFLKFSRLVDWKGKTVAVMNEVLSAWCELFINNVAEKIVEYLVPEKWDEEMQDCT